MKILITSGPTREPIDSVRFITNLSTGETGKVLGEYFASQGHAVTFLAGGQSLCPGNVEHKIGFETFQDLDGTLRRILSKKTFDGIVHAAAVGDYVVEEVKTSGEVFVGQVPRKLDSGERVEVVLKRNFKIVDRIKSYVLGETKPWVVGFKLTHTPTHEDWKKAVDKLYAGGGVDLVVHNDLSERLGAGPRFRIFHREGMVAECESRLDLARSLEMVIRRLK